MNSSPSLNVLVTGASGFVGTATTKVMLSRGHRVTGTTNILTPDLPTDPNLTWVLWDVQNRSVPDVKWDAFDTIVHLAVPSDLHDFPGNAQLNYSLTVDSTFRLLETARESGIPRVLLASTGDVLGPGEGPASEHDVLYVPESFYGATKACAELLVRSYESVLSTAILRFSRPYGPGGDRFLIKRLMGLVARGQEVTIEGKDGIDVNPVWVFDLARGTCLATESLECGIFHLAGPERTTLRRIIELIGEILGKKPIIRHIDAVVNSRRVGSYEVAARVLGYRPTVSLREGLRRLVPQGPDDLGKAMRQT